MKKIIALAFILAVSVSYAAIYVNEENPTTIEYTDVPSDNTKPIQAPPVNTISSTTPAIVAPAASQAAPSTAATPASAPSSTLSTTKTYTSFSIISPKDGETIQNQPAISIQMTSEPLLNAGDKIQLFLDGKAAGAATATLYQELGLVERGSHTVYAVIHNTEGTPIKTSNSITINVHRNSVITSPG